MISSLRSLAFNLYLQLCCKYFSQFACKYIDILVWWIWRYSVCTLSRRTSASCQRASPDASCLGCRELTWPSACSPAEACAQMYPDHSGNLLCSLLSSILNLFHRLQDCIVSGMVTDGWMSSFCRCLYLYLLKSILTSVEWDVYYFLVTTQASITLD